MPPWQAVDEPKHFEYVRLIAEGDEIPAFTSEEASADPELQAWILGSMDEHRFWWYGHAPNYDPDNPPTAFREVWFMGAGSALARTSPVYHWLVALLQPRDRMMGLYLGRLLSVALGALTVLLVGLSARELFPDDAFVRYGAPLFVALTPMFAFLHVGVNNDPLVNTVAALAFLLMTRLIVRGGSVARVLLLAAVVVAAVATKRITVVLVPVAMLSVVMWRAARARRPALTIGAWAVAIAVAGAGAIAWTMRGRPWEMLPQQWQWNIVQYFFNDPEQPKRIVAYLQAPGVWRVVVENVWGMHEGFWASFGWHLIRLPAAAYWLLAGVGLVALVGVVRWIVGSTATSSQRAALVTYAVAIVMTVAAAVSFFLAYLNLPYPVPPQGRYLYVTIVPIAVLLTVGLGAWLPAARQARATAALAVVMAAFNLVALFGFVVPWFYR